MKPLILVTLSPDYDDTGTKIHAVNRSYVQAIEDAGGIPILLPVGVELSEADKLLADVQGVLLPGGWDFEGRLYGPKVHPSVGHSEPELDKLDIQIINWAFKHDVPTLAICRGMQLMNIELGGTLYQHLPDDLPEAMEHKVTDKPYSLAVHDALPEPGSLFASIVGNEPFGVNSRHHQAVNILGKGVIVSGKATDCVVEAIEVPKYSFMLGVEFHPEDMYRREEKCGKLFEAFVRAARYRADPRRL